MLDHKSEEDIYCLHLCFMPLLRKALRIFRRSWGFHKHRSLKHKCPDFVFERGLHDLRMFAIRKKLSFTELCQVNNTEIINGMTLSRLKLLSRFLFGFQQDWEAQDEQDGEYTHNWGNIEGRHTPRIVCPLTPAKDKIIRDFVRRQTIVWKNATDMYLLIRQLVRNHS